MTREEFLARIKKPERVPTWAKVHYLNGFGVGIVIGYVLAELVRLAFSA